MSVPRRLGGGHAELEFGDAGQCALQPRHPAGFNSEQDGQQHQPGTPSGALQSLSLSQQQQQAASSSCSSSSSSSLYSQLQAAAVSPHASFSCATTNTSPGPSSPNSTSFDSGSSDSGSAFSSPAPFSVASPLSTQLCPVSSSSGSSTLITTVSSSSILTGASGSSSPALSPLLVNRRSASSRSQLLQSAVASSSSSSLLSSSPSLKFPLSFKPFKPSPSEVISSIMQQEEQRAAAASSPSSSTAAAGSSSLSPRHLPSPKPSPGVRQTVASPAPAASSVGAGLVAYNTLPAIDRVHRYVVTGTLQQSLFGVVKLAFDRLGRQQVAIKISRAERAQQQLTRTGVSVLENVRREAAVMQYLAQRSASGQLARQPAEKRRSIYAEMFANMTVNEILNNAGGSSSRAAQPQSQSQSPQQQAGGRKVKRMSSRATIHSRVAEERMSVDDDGCGLQASISSTVQESDSEGDCDSVMRSPTPSSSSSFSFSSQTPRLSTNSGNTPTSLAGSSFASSAPSPSAACHSPGPIDSTDLEGERYICRYVEELEDEHFHYLVTDFIPAGDLYSMLTSFPQHRLSEHQARGLFRQMVLGVKYLHLRNVAHLDMSLENMCLDMDDAVRIIDFGVAALHPFTPTAYQTSYFSFPSASSPIAFQPPAATSPSPSAASASPAGLGPVCVPSPHRSFLCKPVKELYAKPGKIRYMSPELFQGLAWDAYANDVFSLGVILYSLLTGRPPFQQAESSDVWFHVIYSGQWLTPNIRKQSSAHVYTHLSEHSLSLINAILKPQDRRPTCEQILQHPWMQQQMAD